MNEALYYAYVSLTTVAMDQNNDREEIISSLLKNAQDGTKRFYRSPLPALWSRLPRQQVSWKMESALNNNTEFSTTEFPTIMVLLS